MLDLQDKLDCLPSRGIRCHCSDVSPVEHGVSELYLQQVIGCVEDVLLLAAHQSLDQLLDHSCLLVNDGQVQRTVGKTRQVQSQP